MADVDTVEEINNGCIKESHLFVNRKHKSEQRILTKYVLDIIWKKQNVKQSVVLIVRMLSV